MEEDTHEEVFFQQSDLGPDNEGTDKDSKVADCHWDDDDCNSLSRFFAQSKNVDKNDTQQIHNERRTDSFLDDSGTLETIEVEGVLKEGKETVPNDPHRKEILLIQTQDFVEQQNDSF